MRKSVYAALLVACACVVTVRGAAAAEDGLRSCLEQAGFHDPEVFESRDHGWFGRDEMPHIQEIIKPEDAFGRREIQTYFFEESGRNAKGFVDTDYGNLHSNSEDYEKLSPEMRKKFDQGLQCLTAVGYGPSPKERGRRDALYSCLEATEFPILWVASNPRGKGFVKHKTPWVAVDETEKPDWTTTLSSIKSWLKSLFVAKTTVGYFPEVRGEGYIIVSSRGEEKKIPELELSSPRRETLTAIGACSARAGYLTGYTLGK